MDKHLNNPRGAHELLTLYLLRCCRLQDQEEILGEYHMALRQIAIEST
jgi:hypothetical protein